MINLFWTFKVILRLYLTDFRDSKSQNLSLKEKKTNFRLFHVVLTTTATTANTTILLFSLRSLIQVKSCHAKAEKQVSNFIKFNTFSLSLSLFIFLSHSPSTSLSISLSHSSQSLCLSIPLFLLYSTSLSLSHTHTHTHTHTQFFHFKNNKFWRRFKFPFFQPFSENINFSNCFAKAKINFK